MKLANLDFDRTPFLVIWEVTRACALACRHCRASAIDQRDPGELSTDEGKALMSDIAAMGTPIMIFTGGDPLQRGDLEELVVHGRQCGMKVGTIPAATERLTRERIVSLAQAGIDQLAFSLDASTAERHDDLRQVRGSFAKVMQAAAWTREAGIPLQINSVLGAWNYDDFDALAGLVSSMGIVFWEVFFLVPTGRGSELNTCTADQCEDLLRRLYLMSLTAPFLIKVTEAPHYRRVALEMSQECVGQPSAKNQSGAPVGHGHRGRMGLSPLPVNSGKGFCFVDHTGYVYPSGFLPLLAGNVRERPMSETYRASPIFRKLRDSKLLTGRCGRCEYRDLCGGSRSRAFAMLGDAHAEDPCCAYVPVGGSGRAGG